MNRQVSEGPPVVGAYDRQISRGTWHGRYDRQQSKHMKPNLAKSISQQDQPESSTMQRMGRYLKEGVADFFGVGEESPDRSQRWKNRRARCSRKLGEIKKEHQPYDEVDGQQMLNIRDPFRVPGRLSESDRGSRPTIISTSTFGGRSFKGGQFRRSRKDSVMKMTWNGLNTLMGSKQRMKKRVGVEGRSYMYEDEETVVGYKMSQEDVQSLDDEVFFDNPVNTDFSPVTLERIKEDREHSIDERPVERSSPLVAIGDDVTDGLGMSRISENILSSITDKGDKRQIGMGFMGRIMNRSIRSVNSDVKKQMDDLDDHRPYFTYWVTFVQILVFIVSVSVYGIAPIGVEETYYDEPILKPNLAIEQTRHIEKDNLWIGPRQADLIHLGAKYSPCMRLDENIKKLLDSEQSMELESACCVRNDGSGCAQMMPAACSETLSTFIKWSPSFPGSNGYTSGSVCGQDPIYCKSPASVKPYLWDQSITSWPLCTNTSTPNLQVTSGRDRHMTCDIVGHPCCHGIQGECFITTQPHCDFIRGYYHPDAFLCSQVNCINEICGMIQFSDERYPDQFYRLWTSLFLHGGLAHLVITVGFQFLIMRDVEKLTGCIRLTIIYIGCGIAGNLSSAIFLPYQVEVGPAGSQFGILACLFVEVLQSWQILKSPIKAIGKLCIGILFLFLLGLLPWIDNWAHLIGFLFGLLLAFALLPYVSFGKFDRRRKIIGIIIALGSAVGLFAILVVLFYVAPIYECPGCQYFNCIPFTATFCENMGVSINKNSSYGTV